MDHFKNKKEFNPQALNNLLYTSNYYTKPEKSVLNKIIKLSVDSFYNDSSYINLDFINSLIILLGNIDPVKAVKIFSDYKEKGGQTSCSLYCNYSYAACKTMDKTVIKKALRDFLEEYERDQVKFSSDRTNYWLILANTACMYAILNDKENMIKFLKLTKAVHHDFNSMKNDDDFKDYREDPDFIKLFK